MRHVMLTAALALSLLAGKALAGSDAGYAAPVDAAPAYAQHLEGFRPLSSRDWPVRGAADEDALIGAVQTAFTGAEGPPPSLVLRRSSDRLIIDVEQTGLADDSVSGTRTRGVFVTESGGGLTLFEAGIQYQCARGADAGNFTDRLCPQALAEGRIRERQSE